MDCVAQIAQIAGVPHTVLPINTFAALGGSALTDPAVAVSSGLDPITQLSMPNTFVPGRNLILLTFAAAYVYPQATP